MTIFGSRGLGDANWDDAGSRIGPPAASFVIVVGLWEAYTRVRGVEPVILPSPSNIVSAFVDNLDLLVEAGGITAITAAGGLVGGIVAGLPIAYGITKSDSFAALALPYVIALRIAPLVAIAPLIFLWIGEGIPARILLVTTLTIFPIVIASYDGLRAVPQPYIDVGRSVAVNSRTQFLRIELPAAAPSVFAGIKLAAALSVVGAVVAEFVTLESGLGFRVFQASRYLEASQMFAALVALSLLGVSFYGIPAAIESHSRFT